VLVASAELAAPVAALLIPLGRVQMIECVENPAKGRVSLDIDLLDPACVGELVDVVGCQLSLNGVVHVGQ
jgi:hypothetical protein